MSDAVCNTDRNERVVFEEPPICIVCFEKHMMQPSAMKFENKENAYIKIFCGNV